MHRRSATLALALLLGCSAHERPQFVHCSAGAIAASEQALRGGAPEETFLALRRDQQAAVAAIYANAGFGAVPICSAVLVSAEHVITAKHCVEDTLRDGTRLTVRFGPDGDAPEQIADVAELQPHPELDLALIVLSHALIDDGTVASLPARTDVLDAAIVGRHAAIAGYGLDDGLVAGSRAFALATIEALEPEFLSTTSVGGSGLCFGDSGGPLVARTEHGVPEVLGILARGSAACDGDDRFTRLDRAAAWLAARIGHAGALGASSCKP